ncbi:P-type conjugative transfer protein TrbL [Parvularcula oceani]|uniref:P-type conjugative transfer protein TrbL n=1 Tax=Parvularcula oceani TaxID=1247963 RepID=UPI0004E1C797|nr:P-type conjugative transfer protein TrbL [Parvularcula oceani]
MDDLSVIDTFLKTFSTYIDSGFGLLQPDVAYLTTFLVTLDITLAGLFWAWGAGTDVVQSLVKKVLYVGFFALVIGNFSALTDIVFRSFAQLGITASGGTITPMKLLSPGFVANTGAAAAEVFLDAVAEFEGFRQVTANLFVIVPLLLSWLIVVAAFFILAVQVFVAIIEFKLTTLAGFVLIPFALWNKTAFLAERVLGNVVASGVKVMVLAIIVGIGTNVFERMLPPDGVEITLDHGLGMMLASLSLFALGIFGPGIANGLVSGAPQLGAGTAVGTAAAVGIGGGLIAAGTARGATAGAGVVAGGAGAAAKAAAGAMGGATAAFGMAKVASGASGLKGTTAGLTGVARAAGGSVASGASGVATRATEGVRSSFTAGERSAFAATGGSSSTGSIGGTASSVASPVSQDVTPDWARKAGRAGAARDATSMTARTIADGDRPGSGANPNLKQED